MAILSTPVEKAEKRLADIRAEVAAEQARLTADLDFDDNVATRHRIQLLKTQEEAAVDSLDFLRRKAAEAAKNATDAKEVAEVEAYRREAEREMPSRLRKVAKHLESAAPEIAAIDAHVKRASHINALARKHGLPSVTDGETLFRATTRRVIPAVYEERTVYEDGAGNCPSVFNKLANGELVPAEGGYMKRQKRIQVSAERVEGGTLPGGRLADGIRLINVKSGRPMWPASR